MKIEVIPTLEIVCTLSDGTRVKSSSKEALVCTIRNKLKGNERMISYYSNQIEQIDAQMILLHKDLTDAKALES